jgi:hypothetical protein
MAEHQRALDEIYKYTYGLQKVDGDYRVVKTPRRGTDPITGAESDSFALLKRGPSARQRRPGKAEQRAQAEAAFRQWQSRKDWP